MTQEQYNRAVKIYQRIEGMERAKREIAQIHCHSLSYTERDNNAGYHLCNNMGGIRDILDRHDRMIREEIDEEIEKLKKKIKEL